MKKSKIVSGVIMAICIILCFYVSVEVIVANNQKRPPSFFSLSLSYVPTNSMEDTIKPGDYVLFSKASFDDVEVGDIIVYRSDEGSMEGNFIIHRVVEKNNDYLTTKGDNNPIADSEQITKAQVYGKFICVIGFMNTFSAVNRNVLFAVLIGIVFIMVILQGVSIYYKYQHDKMLENNKNKDAVDEETFNKLKNEIIEEELEKIRKQNDSNNNLKG